MAISPEDLRNARETLAPHAARDALRIALGAESPVDLGVIGAIVMLLTAELVDDYGYTEAEARAALADDPRIRQLYGRATQAPAATDAFDRPRPARRAFSDKGLDMDNRQHQAGIELDRQALRFQAENGGSYEDASTALRLLPRRSRRSTRGKSPRLGAQPSSRPRSIGCTA